MRLQVHRQLMMLSVMVIVGAAVAWFFLIRPTTLNNRARTEAQGRTTSDLRRRGYPLDASKLRVIRTDLNRQEADLANRLRDTYDKVRSQFDSRLSAYPSVLGFRKSVFTLDYQEAYNKIRQELADQNPPILLDEHILGLGEQSTSTQIHRQVAHMWAVRDVALLANAHSLNMREYTWPIPGKLTEGEPGPRPPERMLPARISVEPVRTYTVSSEEPAYVEEFPVRITAVGKLEDITGFLADLTKLGNFLPVDTATMRKIDEDNPKSQSVEATFVCSAFIILSERSDFDVEVKQEEAVNIPPISGGSP